MIKKIRDMLNKASADIMKWCDKNMEKYNIKKENVI